MDWLLMIPVALAALIVFGPLVAILTTLFILVPLSLLAPLPSMVARASFDCPFSRKKVSVAFLTTPTSGAPTDVLSCSLYAAGGIRCKKDCMRLGETGWTPSPVLPRYSLIADGVSFRG